MARKPTSAELRETVLRRVLIQSASVKSRTGSTLDPEFDRAVPVWAGHIPTRLAFGAPVPAESMPRGVELPGYLHILLTLPSGGGYLSSVPTARHRTS
jgi:uncharacterized protein